MCAPVRLTKDHLSVTLEKLDFLGNNLINPYQAVPFTPGIYDTDSVTHYPAKQHFYS